MYSYAHLTKYTHKREKEIRALGQIAIKCKLINFSINRENVINSTQWMSYVLYMRTLYVQCVPPICIFCVDSQVPCQVKGNRAAATHFEFCRFSHTRTTSHIIMYVAKRIYVSYMYLQST